MIPEPRNEADYKPRQTEAAHRVPVDLDEAKLCLPPSSCDYFSLRARSARFRDDGCSASDFRMLAPRVYA